MIWVGEPHEWYSRSWESVGKKEGEAPQVVSWEIVSHIQVAEAAGLDLGSGVLSGVKGNLEGGLLGCTHLLMVMGKCQTPDWQSGGRRGLLPSRKGKTRGGVGWEEVEGGVELSLEYVELSGGLDGEVHENQRFYLYAWSPWLYSDCSCRFLSLSYLLMRM